MNRFVLAAAPALALLGMGSYAALNAQKAPVDAPGKPDPARVAAGRYAVDPGHTLVRWTVDHFGISDYFGIFGDVTGTLELNSNALGATRLDVTIPVSRVTTASAGLTEHLLRAGKNGAKPDFFGANPADARFVSTAVRRTGPLKADITGNLTLNGVTKPLTIAAEFRGAGAHPMNQRLNIGFRGTTTIKRSDFGIGYGIPMISDRVALHIVAAFEKSDATAQAPAKAPAQAPAADPCGAAKAANAIGRKDSPALRAEVARNIGHTRVRWLPPGTMVTLEYRADRVNIDLDAGGVVVRARCG